MSDRRLLSASRPWLAPAIAILLLAVFALLAGQVAHTTSPTFDEPDQVAVGYASWTQGTHHPYSVVNLRLSQLWAALPLLALEPPPRWQSPEQELEGQKNGVNFGRLFYFANGNDTEAIVFASRVMIILLGVALGAVMFAYSRRLHGDLAGLLTFVFYCFSPLVISKQRGRHHRYRHDAFVHPFGDGAVEAASPDKPCDPLLRGALGGSARRDQNQRLTHHTDLTCAPCGAHAGATTARRLPIVAACRVAYAPSRYAWALAGRLVCLGLGRLACRMDHLWWSLRSPYGDVGALSNKRSAGWALGHSDGGALPRVACPSPCLSLRSA